MLLRNPSIISDNSTELSKCSSSIPKIFDIKKYNFLKQKRQESLEQSLKQCPWTEEEDKILKGLLYKNANLSWQLVAEQIPGRTPSQCMYRWKMCLEPTIKKGKWTKEEDTILKQFISENGSGNWKKVRPFLEGRTTKQIRERYINHLSSGSSFKWNEENDKFLLEKYIIYGSSWVIISKQIKGTTENMVKNRFYSLLRQCVNKLKKKNNNHLTINKKINTELKLNTNTSLSSISDLELEFFSSEKDLILDNNPYVTNGKSLKKNYSLKILLQFLPELLEEKGIDINEVKARNEINTSIELNEDENFSSYFVDDTSSSSMISIKKANAVEKIVKTLDNHIRNEKDIYKEIEIASSQKAQSKSSILFNMQLAQLGSIFEKLTYTLMHKYFECLKSKTIP